MCAISADSIQTSGYSLEAIVYITKGRAEGLVSGEYFRGVGKKKCIIRLYHLKKNFNEQYLQKELLFMLYAWKDFDAQYAVFAITISY